MGVSFIPVKVMLGTDTFKYSGAKTVRCPLTGDLYCALPALYPDVVLMHVNRADKYGNCQIEGISIADKDIARAGRRVIVSAEEIIDNSEIRANPEGLLRDPHNKCGKMPVTLPISIDHTCNFIDAIRNGARAICDIETAVRSDTLCQISLIAVKQGRKLLWDPKAECFTGADAANAMLKQRPFRGEWKLPEV
jgi:hypothetical protein